MIPFLSQYTFVELLLTGIFLVSFVVILLYYFVDFIKVVNHRHLVGNPTNEQGKEIAVTIVVVVKDELYYIEQGLPKLLTQQYKGQYEVVVVNDTPITEDAPEALKHYQTLYPHLYVTTIKQDPRFTHSVRLPKTIGIKAAKYPNILFTTADCIPSSDRWLSLMSLGFIGTQTIITGYSRVEYKKGITNRIERICNVRRALLSLSTAIRQRPCWLPPSNFGITQQAFFSNSGFCEHLRLNQGDSDLFIQRISRCEQTAVLLNPSATTTRYASYNFSNWYNRRKTNTFTFKYYRTGIKWYLTALSIATLLFWSTAIALLVLQTVYLWMVAAGCIAIKTISIILILKKLNTRTQERIPYVSFLLYEIIEPIDTFILYLSRNLKPSQGVWI